MGHRVVHGGEEFTGSVLIDEQVIASIEKFADLAPLHNPPNLAGIRTAGRPSCRALPQVACFDTAFHTTIPKVAYIYGLPYDLYEKYRIRRYGFHGISHRYVARRAAALLGRGKYEINAITCHLGNGCSITAVKNGHSSRHVDGLHAAGRRADGDALAATSTRPSSSISPTRATRRSRSRRSATSTAACWASPACQRHPQSARALRRKGNERATLAIDVFCYRIRKYIGAYTAVLEPLDAIALHRRHRGERRRNCASRSAGA